MEIKKIAFYLPQFHTIPENDEWWGKGFTEWTNVRKAKPIFPGHYQPHIPLNNYYYDLSDVSVMVKQSELAQKYGLDGFCYYHYWFDGKLLLEKPLEQMLKEPKVKIPFCLCWANETWSRTWSGAEKEILIKQKYDESKEGWEAHFYYFLKFFKDERYIKVDNKPMIIIYKPQLIKKLENMIQLWQKLAILEGFDGIYLGFQHHSAFINDNYCKNIFDFGIEFEPWFTIATELNKKIQTKCDYFRHPILLLRKICHKIHGGPNKYSYDLVWKKIIERKNMINMMPGAFSAWDNTPRMGNSANIVNGESVKKFERYFADQLEKSEREKKQFLFINAWNEWAEGAHLEPDEKNGFGYLESIKKHAKSV